MKIWTMQADANNYNNFTLIDDAGWKDLVRLDSFAGNPMREEWVPYQVKILKDKKIGDMQAFFGGVPALNQNAIDKLAIFFQDNIELLPLSYEKDSYFALNVLDLINCVNYEKADINRFSDGNIMSFNRYEFIKEKIENKHIFKIIDEPRKFPFVSNEFKMKVVENELTGFLFTEVWDSEKL